MTTTLVLPDPTSELGGALEVAMAACDAADAISMASFRVPIAVTAKPDASFVTAADTAVERAVRERIAARFPDHGLVGEEYGEQSSGSGRRWFIDPIDGTHNYMRGVPLFATLLGLEIDGQLVVGAVSAPALHRRWFSWQGGGAWAARCRSRVAGTATRRCRSRSPTSTTWRLRRSCTRPCPASWPPASRRASWTCWAPSGVTAAWATSTATCWSLRAPLRPWSRPT